MIRGLPVIGAGVSLLRAAPPAGIARLVSMQILSPLGSNRGPFAADKIHGRHPGLGMLRGKQGNVPSLPVTSATPCISTSYLEYDFRILLCRIFSCAKQGTLKMGDSRPRRQLYPGVYGPLPTFFDDKQDLDFISYKSHLLSE